MKFRLNRLVVVGVLGVILLVGAFAVATAPTTTTAIVATAVTGEATPESTADVVQWRLPEISGQNLDGETFTFPADLATDYALIVVPFNREQQTNAIAWLPTFQAIAKSHPNVSYYSIAALENLDPAIRLLVVTGLNVAVSDSATRKATFVLFLENQLAFTSAVNIASLDEMGVLFVNQQGDILAQIVGAYSEAKEADLQAQISPYLIQ